jgi:hypothetical protein
MVVSEKKKLQKECDTFHVWQWEPPLLVITITAVMELKKCHHISAR